ncbi:MAG: glycosyltransferase family 4 protein [Candidatus Aenigmatarchaeota archaeon]
MEEKTIVVIYPETTVNGVRRFCEDLYSDKELLCGYEINFCGLWFNERLKTNEKDICANTTQEKEKLEEYFKEHLDSINPDIIHLNTYAIDVRILRYLLEKYGDRIVYTVHSVQPYHHTLPYNWFNEDLAKYLAKIANIEREGEDIAEEIEKEYNLTLSNDEREALAIYSYLVSLQKEILKKAKEIIYNSPHTKEIAKEYYGIERGTVIRNGTGIFKKYDENRIKYETNALSWREKFFDRDDIIILYLGRITKNKGILDLLEAFKRVPYLPNLKLIIAGIFEEDIKEIVEKEEEYGKRIFIIEGKDLTDEKIISLYVAADVVVYPSERESAGLVPLEAASLGKLTIVREVDNLLNYVNENLVYGFKSKEELAKIIEEIAKKILHIKKNPTSPTSLEFSKEIYERMRRVREEYSIERTREEYIRIFEKVIEDRRGK